MAVRSDVYVEWWRSPRIIVIEAPSTTITVEDLVDTLRTIEDDLDNLDDGSLLDASGRQDLGGSQFVGITITLNNAQISFEARTSNISAGTATAVSSTDGLPGVILTDISATFQTDNIQPGDTIVNRDDGSVATVISVISQTQLKHYALQDGTSNDWTIGDNYKVYPSIECTITGGNVVAVDDIGDTIDAVQSSSFTSVSKESSTSAAIVETGVSGLTPSESTRLFETALETTAQAIKDKTDKTGFEDGAVWLSSSFGSAGGDGTVTDPTNNINTAVSIAIANNVRRIRMVGYGSYNLGTDMTDFQVVCTSNLGYNFIDLGLNTNDITGTHFYGTGIWKNNGGDITFSQFSAENCNLFSPMDDITGVFTRCFFLGVISTSKFQVVDGLPTMFIDCSAGTPGVSPPTYYITPRFSLKSIQAPTPLAQEVVFQRYTGNIAFEGMDHADSYCDINMTGGVVTLDSDNVAGTYRIGGLCEIVDNSDAGCTVIDNTTPSVNTTVTLTWEEILEGNGFPVGSAGALLEEAAKNESIIIF